VKYVRVPVPPKDPAELIALYENATTPHTRVWDFGTIGTIFVHARSENEPAVVYTAATSVQVSGPYVPTYWIPVAALHELLRGEMTVPPVPWFERIVNSVLTAYARRKEDSSPDGI